jgi:hypothetical protein
MEKFELEQELADEIRDRVCGAGFMKLVQSARRGGRSLKVSLRPVDIGGTVKFQVETVVGFNVRTYYLSENWYAMADMIRYPITINGTQLDDANAFLGYMMDKTVSESDREAMLAEEGLDMFVNYQGIMMGDGEIWLSDPNFGTDAEPVLEIIAINGIVDR